MRKDVIIIVIIDYSADDFLNYSINSFACKLFEIVEKKHFYVLFRQKLKIFFEYFQTCALKPKSKSILWTVTSEYLEND